MRTYVALLRGIGPTNPNMWPAKLKEAFEKMGFKNVRTVISSGNVVFESSSKSESALEVKIEKALPKMLGFSSTTIIRSRDELEKLQKKNPFGKALNNKKLYPLVTFFKKKTTKPFPKKGEGFVVYSNTSREICGAPFREHVKTPDFMTLLEKHYGKEITSRTWKTVERIIKKMNEPV